MILVTGASGQFGNAAINSLLKKGVQSNKITAMVRNEESIQDFKEKGIHFAIGDYNNYSSLVQAFIGVEKLLFISSSDVVNRQIQHENVVNAAIEAGVKHIIYTSFQSKNETETSPIWMVAKSHLHTEKELKASGINYTILKNSLYMDLVPGFVGEKILETGVIFLPAGDGKVSAVLRSEMAEAAAEILVGSNHEGKVYDFTNTEAFSYKEVAQVITEITGKTINYVSPTPEEYTQTLAQYGVPNEVIELLSGFAIAQAHGELEAVGSDLELLLGRKPTTIRAFLAQVY